MSINTCVIILLHTYTVLHTTRHIQHTIVHAYPLPTAIIHTYTTIVLYIHPIDTYAYTPILYTCGKETRDYYYISYTHTLHRHRHTYTHAAQVGEEAHARCVLRTYTVYIHTQQCIVHTHTTIDTHTYIL